jgi:hypothetical protein
MRWRLVLKEFGPELKYIKGTNNVVADALSHLEFDPAMDAFPLDEEDLPEDAFPIRYRDIAKAQSTDKKLLNNLTKKPTYSKHTFRGGDKNHKLICHNEKISIPLSLQKRIVNWYHKMLCHPGETRTEATI